MTVEIHLEKPVINRHVQRIPTQLHISANKLKQLITAALVCACGSTSLALLKG